MLSASVVISYSLSAYAIESYDYNEFHFLARQGFAAVLGILIMWIFSQFDAQKSFNKLVFALFFGALTLVVVLQFLPESLATSAGGAKRWIRLPGFSLAPSEFLKIGFIGFLAWSFSRTFVNRAHSSVWREFLTLLPYIFLFLLFAFFIAILQNDLGQVVLMALVLGVMLLFAGGSLKLVGILLFSATSVAVAAIVTSAHRINRIKTWWGSVQDLILSFLPRNLAENLRIENAPEPYQIYYSLTAMHNGGWLGRGLGEGTIKLGFLSEVHTDIVLAGICEEMGFLGLVVATFAFGAIMWRIFRVANRTPSDVYALFCIGVATSFGFAFLINAFGITGIIPIKGIAVPFLSYGGSSILASCVAVGMVLSISKKALG